MAAPNNELLEEIARGQLLDSSQWPGIRDYCLFRLTSIVHNDFPAPPLLGPAPSSARLDEQQQQQQQQQQSIADPPSSSPSRVSPSQDSQATNKENAPPSSSSSPSFAPIANGPAPAEVHERMAAAAAAADDDDHDRLQPMHHAILSSVRTALTTSFANSPPYTIQRLAELILRPRSHYRFVGPYLRAVDRVMSVSSGADVFPLVAADRSGSAHGAAAAAAAAAAGGVLANGTTVNAARGGASFGGFLGGSSDEGLGGALLTPIPWLHGHGGLPDEPHDAGSSSHHHHHRHHMDDDANGLDRMGHHDPALRASSHVDGRDPLRDIGAVTQGELLRREQEAGIVPGPEPIGRHSIGGLPAADDGPTSPEHQFHPHPSGPGEVGVEDVGPQAPHDARMRFDVEAALGKRAPHTEPEGGADTSRASQAMTANENVSVGDTGRDESEKAAEVPNPADDDKMDGLETEANIL